MPNTSIQQQRLRHSEAFLHDYLLHKSLQESLKAEAQEPASQPLYSQKNALPKSRSMDYAELLPGEIRLLAQPEEMLCLLLLAEQGCGLWLVLPFSRFPFPATEEEFLLGGGRASYLDVLQFWNMRSLNAMYLRRGWRLGELNVKELEQVALLLRAHFGDEPLANELLAKTGLPIYEVGDPRSAYKAEALQDFAALDQADLQWMQLCDQATMSAKTTEWKSSGQFELAAVGEQTMPYAAAGESQFSRCLILAQSPRDILTEFMRDKSMIRGGKQETPYAMASTLSDFRLNRKERRNLLWELPQTQLASYVEALFFHQPSQRLLASGYADENNIVLCDWLDEEHPEIKEPGDISIVLCQESLLE